MLLKHATRLVKGSMDGFSMDAARVSPVLRMLKDAPHVPNTCNQIGKMLHGYFFFLDRRHRVL